MAEVRVERHLWRNDAQHDPRMLLGYIRSEKWHGGQDRERAMTKGLSLGVSPQKIRAAILTHATKTQGHRGLSLAIEHLKEEAMTKGALMHRDLPEVKNRPRNMKEAMQRAKERAEAVRGEKS